MKALDIGQARHYEHRSHAKYGDMRVVSVIAGARSNQLSLMIL